MYGIPIKTKKEIDIMRKGGKLLAEILQTLKNSTKPGIDAWDYEETFIEFCKRNNLKPACKGYSQAGFPPFPTGLCLSFNEQAVHCFPTKGRTIVEGDLITIDTVIEHNGYFLDSAITFGVGKIDKVKTKIMNTTKDALENAISQIKPGIKIGVLSNTIQSIVEKAGFSVLEDYSGHGIGKKMHEPPEIPCYGRPSDGPHIEEGMVLAVEPLVCENSNVLEHKNFWETRTVDYGMFAQEEHTVLVTNNGYEILTTL